MKHMNASLLAAVVSASLAFGAPAMAQERNTRDVARDAYEQVRDFQQGRQGELRRDDIRVAEKALNAGAGSIELARLAEERARDSSLRDFARDVRQHHQDANRELASLSRELNADRARPEELDRWAIKRLRAIDNDREFERAYAELAVARHQMAIDGLEMVANNDMYSRELRNFAQQQLGDIRQHLRVAQRIEQDVRQVAARDD